MADFSDKEDLTLVQIAFHHEGKGKKRISWTAIAKKLRTKKRPEQLRLRLVRLKKRFGGDLAKFPLLMHAKRSLDTQKKSQDVSDVRGEQAFGVSRAVEHEIISTVPSSGRGGTSIQQLMDLLSDSDDNDETPAIPELILRRTAGEQTDNSSLCTPKSSLSSVHVITPSAGQRAISPQFKALHKRAKRMEHNAGELTPIRQEEEEKEEEKEEEEEEALAAEIQGEIDDELRIWKQHLLDAYWAIRRNQTAYDKIVLGHRSMYGELIPSCLIRMFEIFKQDCNFNSESVFVDLGSGLCKVVYMASKSGIRESIGIESEEQHIEVVNTSIEELKPTNFNLIKGHVEHHFDKLHNATHFYSFDWLFSPNTLKAVYDFMRERTGVYWTTCQKSSDLVKHNVAFQLLGEIHGKMSRTRESHKFYVYKID